MSNTSNIGLVDSLFELAKTIREKIATSHSSVPAMGLAQLRALMYLGKVKKATMSDLANHFGIEMPSATSLLNKLYIQKLVKRTVDIHDRRLVIVSLTPAGKKLFNMSLKHTRGKLEELLSCLTETEKSNLLKILNKLNNQLKPV